MTQLDWLKKWILLQDFKSNAEKARQELHLREYKNRQLKIRFSSPGTALKVRNLSSWVTNELLEKSFSVSYFVFYIYMCMYVYGKGYA